MSHWLVAVLIGLQIPTAAAAESKLRYSKPVSLSDLSGEELVAISLDSEVYQATRADFPDVRLFQADGGEVAYVLRKAPLKKARTERHRWAAEHLALKPHDDGSLEITFDIDLEKHPQPPQGIHLRTRLRNFEHRVRVEASADMKSWQPLLEEGLIFDYSQFMDVRNLSLEFDTARQPKFDGKRAYYRMTIEDVTQEQQSQLVELTRHLVGQEEESRRERITINRQPLRIDRIDLWREEIQHDIVSDRHREYPLRISKTAHDAEAQQTYVYLSSKREPIVKFTIVTPERNFSRTAHVEVMQQEGAQQQWQAVGSATLTRIDIRTLQRESLEVHCPESRHAEYRLVIENRDSQPLEVTAVSAQGNVYELVFLAAQDSGYRLAYGSDAAPAPHYDTAALAAALHEGFAPSQASLGAAEELVVAPEPTGPWLPRLLNNGPVVVAVIGLLILMLAVGLYRAASRIDEVDESGQP